jgi:hypothetical protein
MTDQSATGGVDPVDALEATDVAFYAGSQRACSQDSCTLGRTEAEKAWETLMSGLPDPVSGNYTLPANPNPYVTPKQSTYNMVMDAIRPGNEHAIQPIADIWRALSNDSLATIEGDLSTAIKNLSNTWKGDDFDGLEENMTTTLSNLGRTREKIITLADELHEAASNLRTHQKLAETPFPPAGFNLVNKESGCCDDYKLHDPNYEMQGP